MRDTFIPLLQCLLTTGEVTGLKKCQKMVHILQECGYDFSTILFLRRSGTSTEQLQSKFGTLKPHLLHVYPKALALADECTAFTAN